jgi:hypothetical protein
MLTVDVAYKGAPDDQQLAARLFDTLIGYGRFMAFDVPIRVSVDSLVEFLNKDGAEITAEKVQAIAAANPDVFAIEDRQGVETLVTTRSGRSPISPIPDTHHGFAQRLMTPLPKPEAPAAPPRERPQVDVGWRGIERLLPGLDDLDVIEDEAEVEAESPILSASIVAEPQAAVVEEETEAETEAPLAARVVRVPLTSPTKFNEVDNVELADAIAERLREDARVANFGDQWMLEERVPRFSRGDLRRLKDYIQEQEQPLTDDVLVQDVLGIRPGSVDFDLWRFAINFRLTREHREFDFVGTPNQRFWSTSSLPQIGTTRRKPNEIGTDYRFLLDDAPDRTAYRTLKSVDHVLTFYEHYHGLLPYDAEIQSLLPAPVVPNQRSAVLTFECPQSYTTYLVELRYPTPNRGGFILGLDDFFNESLVPGALISIERTDNDGHYLVRYVQSPAQNGRLLELEDRRQRYVFRPTSYSCGVLEESLLTEERFPNLAGEKPLEEKVRRRPESLIAATFERLNHKSDGPGFVAEFQDLLVAVNIERPFSERYLRSVLDNDETGAFARDPDGNDAYTYVPGTNV